MSHQLDLPPFCHYHRLSNGIEMIGQYMPSLSSVTFGCQFDAAVVHEPQGKPGLAHLLELMLFQGTQKRDARALHAAFEKVGARKGMSTGLEMARVWVQVVSSKLATTLELINEILLKPAFAQENVEQIRQRILQEIHRRDDEPARRIVELARARFYDGTAFARPMLGTAESVRELTQQDVLAFWRARYQPDAMLFAIAGKFQWDDVVEHMETLFGDWQGRTAISSLQQPVPTTDFSVDYRQDRQEHLCMMFPFPNYGDSDYSAALVANEVLGGNMNSRLFVEAREKRSLVYNIFSLLVSNKAMGAVRVYAGTTPQQGRECFQVIVDELRKLEQNGITADELQCAKVRLKSQLIMKGESSSARMGTMAHSWWFERAFRTHQEVKAALDAVTEEHVLAVLRRFSPANRLAIAAIGPLSGHELGLSLRHR